MRRQKRPPPPHIERSQTNPVELAHSPKDPWEDKHDNVEEYRPPMAVKWDACQYNGGGNDNIGGVGDARRE